jgi:hypothetical protein
VVVLSNGMGRWLSMELAATSGVSAGMEFSFPNDTLDACFRSVIPGLPESSPFASQIRLSENHLVERGKAHATPPSKMGHLCTLQSMCMKLDARSKRSSLDRK